VFNDDTPIFYSTCCITKAVYDAIEYDSTTFAVITLVEPNPLANYAPNPYNEQLYRIRIDACESQPFYNSYYCNRVGYFPNTNVDYDILGTGLDITYTDLRAITLSDQSILIVLIGFRSNPNDEDHTFSHENYVVNAIRCSNINCTTYSNYLVVDSLLLWNGLNFGTQPLLAGINVAISPATNLPVITLSTHDGSPFLLYCLANDCSSVSLVRTSDSLAGHYGDFSVVLQEDFVLIASTATWGIVNQDPIVTYFNNQYASPLGELCTSLNVGNFYSVQGLVLLCTRVGDRLFNPTTIYTWAQVGGSPRSYGADGNHYSNLQTGQEANL